jgi:hypothetical protein
MSALQSKFITRTKKVNGFAGVGTQVAVGDTAIFIVAANEPELRDLVAEILPDINPADLNLLPLTIIQTDPKD